ATRRPNECPSRSVLHRALAKQPDRQADGVKAASRQRRWRVSASLEAGRSPRLLPAQLLLLARDGAGYMADLGLARSEKNFQKGLDGNPNQWAGGARGCFSGPGFRRILPSLELRFALFHEGASSFAKVLRVHAGCTDR